MNWLESLRAWLHEATAPSAVEAAPVVPVVPVVPPGPPPPRHIPGVPDRGPNDVAVLDISVHETLASARVIAADGAVLGIEVCGPLVNIDALQFVRDFADGKVPRLVLGLGYQVSFGAVLPPDPVDPKAVVS